MQRGHFPHAGTDIHGLFCIIRCGWHKRGTVVGIIAVAAAIHRAKLERLSDSGCSDAIGRIFVSRIDTQNDFRAVGTMHHAGNIVAAKDATDAVAVDDDHFSITPHWGHAAATKDVARNHQARFFQSGERK